MSPSTNLLRSGPRNVYGVQLLAAPSSGCCRSCTSPIFLVSASSRSLATVNVGPKALPDTWFAGSIPQANIPGPYNDDQRKPPDSRTLKLGKTLRILQERLPTLLQHPLPQDILSPQISLHLFPSTHPHLPVVSGRVGYNAALWTSPLAWGRLPLVGNVKLEILSERMVKAPNMTLSPTCTRPEQLLVRWKTIGKTRHQGTGASYKGIGASGNVDKITEWLGGGKGEDDSKEFTGLFIFEFDEEGRIARHTIEHVQEGGNWEKGVGAKVVGLTDWLLGGMRNNGRGEEGSPCPAFWVEPSNDNSRE